MPKVSFWLAVGSLTDILEVCECVWTWGAGTEGLVARRVGKGPMPLFSGRNTRDESLYLSKGDTFQSR